MRSSDVFNAFPYDWHAASAHLKFLLDLLREGESGLDLTSDMEVWFHTSNYHIRAQDKTAVEEFLKK
jgi:hypothetical protein